MRAMLFAAMVPRLQNGQRVALTAAALLPLRLRRGLDVHNDEPNLPLFENKVAPVGIESASV